METGIGIKGVMHYIADDLAEKKGDDNTIWFEEVVDWDTFEKWCAKWS